ncbi:MAG TPA: family 1 glycosylhydrolase [Thermoanaerobaculia bacterium]|nr:family 1 glycosylhydrolase [Thermoanaerobaculia bacterium]
MPDPPQFLWGVATSAYQIEGATENDWTEWERLGKLKEPGVRCGKAAGHRERWRSDLALLPTIGANAYRFSLEWSRIEPRRGHFDEAALLEARETVELLTRLGVEPVVTLHHFTHPSWFWAEGGWEKREGVESFRRFAAAVADALGSRVRLWVTFNEPIVLLLGGYLGGVIPPGRRSFPAASAALENLLRAHADVAGLLKDRNPSARVGIAHNMLDFAPDRPRSALDRRLARAGERLYNLALLESIATGKVDWVFPGEGRAAFRVPDLPASNDYVGINYYSRVHMRFRGTAPWRGEYFYRDRAGRGLTESGWEVHPSGFERVLRVAAEVGRPLLVTENGIATRDDRRRCDFLREHAMILAHVRKAGLPVEGYFYWSLLDNFEWLEGFRPRFGLFEVDYATFARRRRPSADLFAALGKRFTAGEAGGWSSGVSRR